MVNYICEKCDKSFTQKCHYIVHMNRLRACKNKNKFNKDNDINCSNSNINEDVNKNDNNNESDNNNDVINAENNIINNDNDVINNDIEHLNEIISDDNNVINNCNDIINNYNDVINHIVNETGTINNSNNHNHNHNDNKNDYNNDNNCVNHEENDKIDEVNDYNDVKQNNNNYDPNVINNINNTNIDTNNSVNKNNKENTYIKTGDKLLCIYCNNIFSTPGTLKRHLNGRCKKMKEKIGEKKEKEELTTKIITLQEQINSLTKILVSIKDEKSSISNTNNGTIDNSMSDNSTNVKKQVNNQVNSTITNNNIKIEFGKEDLDKISNEFFIKTLVNNSGAAIPSKIIEGIHFNPEFKEFMNVFITDISRNKAMVFDGKTWNIANADEVVNTLFDRAIIFCENRNEELHNKIQKNDKINKKINKEMYVMDIMVNNEPHDYNEYNQPIDSKGKILSASELIRGKCLSAKAKEHLKNNLYNKKTLIIK